METGNDTGAVTYGFVHAVQLTGDADLAQVGGESAVIRRIVGHVRPIVGYGTDADLTPFYLATGGVRIIQTIQLLHIPESTEGFAIPHQFASPPMTSQGLGGEDILWTRTVWQPAAAATESWDNLQYTNYTDGAVNVFPVANFFQPDSRYDIDISVARRLEEDKQLWMVTYADAAFQLTPPPGPTSFIGIAYGGYLRELVTKGA